MHPEDLMKPDLFSEIVLLGSGSLMFASLLLIAVSALTQTWPLVMLLWRIYATSR